MFESFKQLFVSYRPKDYRNWEEERDIDKLQDKLTQGMSAFEDLEGKSGDTVKGSLPDIRKKVDQLLFALPHMMVRWDDTETEKVIKAVATVGRDIAELKKQFKAAPVIESEATLRKTLEQDIENLTETHTQVAAALYDRNFMKVGELTGLEKSGLVQGWNPVARKFEYWSPEEWKKIIARSGSEKPVASKSASMEQVNSTKVFVQKQYKDGDEQSIVDLSENRLVVERDATEKLRAKLSGTVNDRMKNGTKEVKKGVENHCDMAVKLASLLEKGGGYPEDFDPADLFKKGGLLFRLIGNTKGQGQSVVANPAEIMKGITEAAARLKDGKGEGEDAAKITSFIANFVDGLTEVNEKSETGEKQFDALWPKFQSAFGLKKEDKAKLMERVDGYKKIAGGISDTLSGKGARKGLTRQGLMPNDENYKINDPEALIKGDISGSMHSQLLAQELSESLMGGGGIKDPGADVRVKDKAVLNARVLDALLMTAGGKDDKGSDQVYHTAYEMINGMEAITGCPDIDQMTATSVMVMLRKGMSFTDAMEELLPPDELPWLAEG